MKTWYKNLMLLFACFRNQSKIRRSNETTKWRVNLKYSSAICSFFVHFSYFLIKIEAPQCLVAHHTQEQSSVTTLDSVCFTISDKLLFTEQFVHHTVSHPKPNKQETDSHSHLCVQKVIHAPLKQVCNDEMTISQPQLPHTSQRLHMISTTEPTGFLISHHSLPRNVLVTAIKKWIHSNHMFCAKKKNKQNKTQQSNCSSP